MQKEKAAISCPFNAQGVDTQLPACPMYLVSTRDAFQLPLGNELTTPNHNETTQNIGKIMYYKLNDIRTPPHLILRFNTLS